MITLPLYDHEIDLLKRALLEFRDSERESARNHGPLHRAYEPALRNADMAHQIFERLLYSNAVQHSGESHGTDRTPKDAAMSAT